ncbi:lipopolysaccharide biosynthesis protein [Aquiflexum lacus]|uniref:lipopolysaccharide biosynthesis protein n=1 Tax=Aquiflexum lacus TaxID=2483805 RepID=UPI00189472F5|nr:oligosaccharide flippase family protein [Aquiflexum lacus]
MNIPFLKNASVRTEKFIKNSFLILLFQGFNIISNFLLVSITLDFLGVEEYGVWITLTSFVTWFSFLDIGLAHGLRNKYAEAKTENDFLKIKSLVSTAFFSLLLISTIGFSIVFLIGYNLNWAILLNGPEHLKDELKNVGLFMVFTFFLRLVLNIVAVLKTAEQQPSVATFLTTSGNLLSLLGIFLIIEFYNPSFLQLGVVLSISQVLPIFLAFIFYFSSSYKIIFPRVEYFSKSNLNSIFSIGFKFFVIQLLNLVILQSNILIIAHVCGPESVADYSIAFKYLWLLMILHGAVITPLWSASTEAYAKKDKVWLKNIMSRLNTVFLGLVLIGILLIFGSSFFYKLWLKGNVEVDYLLLFLIFLNFTFTMRYSTFRMFMNGVGKIRLQLFVTTIQAVLHIPLAIVAANYFDVYGVIIVSITWTFLNSIWEPIQFKKIISESAEGIWSL